MTRPRSSRARVSDDATRFRVFSNHFAAARGATGAGLAITALTTSAAIFSSGCGGASSLGGRSSLRSGAHESFDAKVGSTKARTAPLVVGIVVDQLAAWVLDERLAALPKDGGFARLVREGTRVRSLVYAHAATDTAPGHAALYTGAPPRDSGVPCNDRIEASGDRTPGHRVSILRSVTKDAVETLSSTGKHSAGGSSPALLLADGVSDTLRDAAPRSRIVSISIKDRGAILPGGRGADVAIWFDVSEGAWVTSSAYTDHFPKWATELGRTESMAARRATPWTPLDPTWLAAHAETPADQAGEGDYEGLGVAFPHDLAHARSPALAIRATPFADEATFALALAALDRFALGRGEASLDDDREDDIDPADRPMLLALSFSANDYISHVFGPHSQEAWDELLRFDRSLANFERDLDQRFGADKWSIVLSADHGAGIVPETGNVARVRPYCQGAAASTPDKWERPCGPLGRLVPDTLASELEAAAEKALGGPPTSGAWVAGVADPYIVYGAPAEDLEPTKRATLTRALIANLTARPEVARAYDVRALPARCPAMTDSSIDALVCRSYAPSRGGDLYVVTKPGYFFDPSMAVGKGESHGTPYLYDRTVPLLVRAPGKVAAGALIETLPFGTFAHTMASLVGAPAPSNAANAPDLTHLEAQPSK